MHIISKTTLQPQSCQTQMWAAKGSQSGPQRLPCEMPSTNTEGKELYLHQPQEQGQSRLRGMSPRQAPCLTARVVPWESSPGPGAAGAVHPWGLSPRAVQMGPNLLAGGRKAGCRRASLGPWCLGLTPSVSQLHQSRRDQPWLLMFAV